jgi:hypothetical protein
MVALAVKPPQLEMWTVYRYPKDFPHDYVLRRWVIEAGQAVPQEAHIEPTLEALRAHVPRHCSRLQPSPGDDPVIVETWI